MTAGHKKSWNRTHVLIQEVALDLFETHGFDATTVAQIANHAGVSGMTLFRHFTTKHGVLFDDPYDDVIADAVGEQPRGVPPLDRAVAGFRHAWQTVPEPETELVRRRVRLIASTSTLRGEMSRNNAVTEALIADQLSSDGANPVHAKIAAAALLAAVTAAMFEWSLQERTALGDYIEVALSVLDGCDG
ncbi:MAG: TetR/AcrR family transcriptional regulator [Ilumatobacteraceae bacterium]